MPILVLSGLPEHLELPELVYFVKNTLTRDGIDNLWVKDIKEEGRTGRLKEARIVFEFNRDAYRAMEVLDGLMYTTPDMRYRLKARIEDFRPPRRSPSPKYHRDKSARERSRERRRELFNRNDYPRERERNTWKLNPSIVAREIDLVRKERFLVEEERRLLVEKQRFDENKEYMRRYKPVGVGRDRSYRTGAPTSSLWTHHAAETKTTQRPPSPPPPQELATPPLAPPPLYKRPTMPQFNILSHLLVADMHPIIEKFSYINIPTNILEALVRSALRQRIHKIIPSQPIISADEMIATYRYHYPTYTDEELIRSLIEDAQRHKTKEDEEKNDNQVNKKKYDGKTFSGI